MVQTIRRRLGEQGEYASWASLRAILEGQQRVTATFQRKDGRTLHVRKAARAEPRQTGNLSRARDRSRSWRHQENDRLTSNPAKETEM